MFCEIEIDHRGRISEQELQSVLKGGNLGTEISLDEAYKMCPIYRDHPPRHSLFAHETVDNCFGIVLRLNLQRSTYHLQGRKATVSTQTVLRAAEQYTKQLLKVFHDAPIASRISGSLLAIRLFEDDAKETGVEGQMVTLRSVLREKFAWGELRSTLIPFLTTLLLLRFGLKQDSPKAAGVSVVIAFFFVITEVLFKYYRDRGKIMFEVKKG